MYTAVAGNIGSGKTTLTRLLARHYGWTPRFEAVAHNPYLDDYYRDTARWSLNMEVFFLKERFKDLLAINRSGEDIIQDRTIFEGVYVFAANNHALGNLSDRDFDSYMALFEQMLSVVRLPDLLIYLRASIPHLVANIQQRGRACEQTIELSYLRSLSERYERFVMEKYPGEVLVVDVDDLDFLHRPHDLASVIARIDQRLFNLFPDTPCI